MKGYNAVTPIEWIGQYENYLALIKNRRPNTARGYVSDLKLLLKFAGVQDWRDFTEQQTVEYLKEMKKTQQDQSIARKIYCFRGFFKFLRKKGAITVDPWEDIETHAINRKLPVLLSVQEMNKLLTCIRQPLSALVGIPNEEAFLTIRDRAMLETLYSAGLRVSELVGLDWGRIDFNKREVRVLGKGNKERTVPVGQKALEALAEYRPHYERQWERKAETVAPVFLSMCDMRINQRTIPRTIAKWCATAGVKRVNPHAFRHSCATHMLDGGADIRVIQVMLGHASIQTTEIYARVAIRKVKSAHSNSHPRA